MHWLGKIFLFMMSFSVEKEGCAVAVKSVSSTSVIQNEHDTDMKCLEGNKIFQKES